MANEEHVALLKKGVDAWSAWRDESCFINYSTKDQEFADRLHADLQNKGVRCWFAPRDMRTGDKILDTVGDAIRLRDKVLIILSENSVNSKWVEREVKAALDEEDQNKRTVLFPIRIDNAVEEDPKRVGASATP